MSETAKSPGDTFLDAIRLVVREEIAPILANIRGTETYPDGTKPNLTIKEAADFSRLAPSTIRLYIRKRQLKAFKVGRRVLIARADLERFLSLNPTGLLEQQTISRLVSS
jgi:excisionase family DNA binding protein